MKDAEQWHDEGVTNIASTLHRVDVKEIRAIQIDALREAREIVERAVAHYHSAVEDRTERDNYVRAVALEKLDKKIMELELK